MQYRRYLKAMQKIRGRGKNWDTDFNCHWNSIQSWIGTNIYYFVTAILHLRLFLSKTT
jgi:hypothetical protein